MAAKALEEKIASSSEAPAEQAVAVLRDVVLGPHPNDADSVKAKEQASWFTSTYQAEWLSSSILRCHE